MAERRMFAKTIIDSDLFLDMPLSTQCLYFHLSLRADDDGFINNPKKVQRMVGNTDDDLKLLIAKNFIIPFESGVVVIKHWKIHNYIRNDRYKETLYKEEKARLSMNENKEYIIGIPTDIPHGIPKVEQRETQVRLGKDRIGKVILKKEKETNFDILIKQYTDNEDFKNIIIDFIRMRKTINKPLTDKALKLLLTKLDSFTENEKEKKEILEKSIINSWSDIYELKENNATKNNKSFKPKVTSQHFNAGNEAFRKYNPDELEALLKESQKDKWQ